MWVHWMHATLTGVRLMSWFRRLALFPFIKAHPPRKTQPVVPDLIAAYAPVLPVSLLELWRQKGLGHYGSMQRALIDPRQWQPVLDRWIVSPPDAVRPIAIALTPFGALVYYRKLTPTDEEWPIWIRSGKPPAI